MPGFGHNSYLSFGEETVWGTPVAATNWLWIDKGGDNANQALNWIDTTACGLLGTATEMSFQGTKDARGDFTFEMPFQGTERLLKHCLGQQWFSEPYGGADLVVKRWTFDINDDLTEMKHDSGLSGKKGLTFKMMRDLRTFVYSGAKVQTLEFSSQPGQNLRCKVGFVAKGYNDEAPSGVPAYNNAGFFNYYQGVLTLTNSTIGTILVPLESWSLTLNNALDEDRYLFSGQDRKEPVRKSKIEVVQKFTAEFSNTVSPNQNTLALFTEFKNGAKLTADMTFTGPTIDNGAGGITKEYKLRFLSATDAHQARVRAFPVKVENEGRIKVEIEVKHYRDAAETAPTLANSRRELRIIMENKEVIANR